MPGIEWFPPSLLRLPLTLQQHRICDTAACCNHVFARARSVADQARAATHDAQHARITTSKPARCPTAPDRAPKMASHMIREWHESQILLANQIPGVREEMGACRRYAS